MRDTLLSLVPFSEVARRDFVEVLTSLKPLDQYPDLADWFTEVGFSAPQEDQLLIETGVESADEAHPEHLRTALQIYAYNLVCDGIVFIWNRWNKDLARYERPRYAFLLEDDVGRTTFRGAPYVVGVNAGSCLIELMRRLGIFVLDEGRNAMKEPDVAT